MFLIFIAHIYDLFEAEELTCLLYQPQCLLRLCYLLYLDMYLLSQRRKKKNKKIKIKTLRLHFHIRIFDDLVPRCSKYFDRRRRSIMFTWEFEIRWYESSKPRAATCKSGHRKRPKINHHQSSKPRLSSWIKWWSSSNQQDKWW